MSRELPPQQAFQTHCLAQMGVVSWLSSSDSVTGTVFMPIQPWPIAVEAAVGFVPPPSSAGFKAVEPVSVPVEKRATDEKDPLVHHLREQLNAGPEIIVEDLQPIEELAVDIVVEPDPALNTHITRLNIYAYALSNKLLILSDVPEVFSQAEEIERLALKMGQALLKQPINEWQGSAFSWPGALKNPHFGKRTDWLFGALESYVGRLVKDFPDTPLLVLAGAQITQLVEDLAPESPLKHYPTARIVSLSELYRIPELRKEAWGVMQSSLFR